MEARRGGGVEEVERRWRWKGGEKEEVEVLGRERDGNEVAKEEEQGMRWREGGVEGWRGGGMEGWREGG